MGSLTAKGYASGGYAGNTAPAKNVSEWQDMSAALVSEFRAMRDDMNTWQTKLKSYVLLTDINDQQAKLSGVKNDVTM
jgi:hypothetical protein